MAVSRALVVVVLAVSAVAAPVFCSPLAAFEVVDGGISSSLTDTPGDAANGRLIVGNRQVGMCLLCHPAPNVEDRFQGDISTNLAGAGTRWTVPQLRLRIVNARMINPASVMPAYYRVDGLQRVATSARHKPILNAQQVEDVVAWLASLK